MKKIRIPIKKKIEIKSENTSSALNTSAFLPTTPDISLDQLFTNIPKVESNQNVKTDEDIKKEDIKTDDQKPEKKLKLNIKKPVIKKVINTVESESLITTTYPTSFILDLRNVTDELNSVDFKDIKIKITRDIDNKYQINIGDRYSFKGFLCNSSTRCLEVSLVKTEFNKIDLAKEAYSFGKEKEAMEWTRDEIIEIQEGSDVNVPEFVIVAIRDNDVPEGIEKGCCQDGFSDATKNFFNWEKGSYPIVPDKHVELIKKLKKKGLYQKFKLRSNNEVESIRRKGLEYIW